MSKRLKDGGESSDATFRDVMEEEYGDDDAVQQISPIFNKLLDRRLTDMYDAKGVARFALPPEEMRSLLIAQAFQVRCGEWVKSKIKRSRNLNGAELYQNIGAPSTFGKPSGWSKWQKDDDLPIMCGRPSERTWLNIQIMHPVFHQITDILENGDPKTDDYLMAAELCAAMPEAYVVENSRRDAIIKIFNKYMARSATVAIGVNCIADAFDTDGTSEAAGFNVEFKNEKGEGDSDPYMQNIGYYLRYWGKSGRATAQNRHCCPWMLVEVLGQEIGISGAVYACGVPCIQPLSTNVPFLPVPGDERMQKKQARLCCAMRHGFTALQQFYSSKQSATVDSQAGFPYHRTFKRTGEEDITQLVYTGPLVKSPNRMIFLARTEDNDKRVLVKFCARYNEQAHRIAEAGGFAPTLHSCVLLDCGFYMVVMEYIENCRFWGQNGEEESTASKAKLQSFLSLFANNNLVHGDLRAPNILVNDENIFVLDFDWTGEHEQATYPVAVNRQEDWADGVEVGQVMKKEHDHHCVRRLLGCQRQGCL